MRIEAYRAAYRVGGMRGLHLRLLEEERSGKRYATPMDFAYRYAALGDKEQALTWLERAYAERVARIDFLAVEPHYDSLRSEPRFQDLLRRMNLSQ